MRYRFFHKYLNLEKARISESTVDCHLTIIENRKIQKHYQTLKRIYQSNEVPMRFLLECRNTVSINRRHGFYQTKSSKVFHMVLFHL